MNDLLPLLLGLTVLIVFPFLGTYLALCVFAGLRDEARPR